MNICMEGTDLFNRPHDAPPGEGIAASLCGIDLLSVFYLCQTGW